MGIVIKKCIACGTFNQLEATECKNCQSSLLAEVDQDDAIMDMDPMEAAINDTVSGISGDDDMVEQILREQAETAKNTVKKEREKEERKQARNKKNGAFSFGDSEAKTEADKLRARGGVGAKKAQRFNEFDGSASSSHGFSLGSEDNIDYEKEERRRRREGGRWGARTGNESSDSGDFKIKGEK